MPDCFSDLFCNNPFGGPRVMFNSVAPQIRFITEGGTSRYRQRRG